MITNILEFHLVFVDFTDNKYLKMDLKNNSEDSILNKKIRSINIEKFIFKTVFRNLMDINKSIIKNPVIYSSLLRSN